MQIVLATSNEHKVKEINAIVQSYKPCMNREQLADMPNANRLNEKFNGTVSSQSDITFILPPSDFDPEETGTTFVENSYIKARKAWEISKMWTLADDSGLCIDALGGKPGIYSARYAETAEKRIERVLSEMAGVENRAARFECAMTLLNPEGEIAYQCTGVCEGSIISEQRGTHGFGYDPIFLLKNSDKTIAELADEEKNAVSHRSKALNSVLDFLAKTPPSPIF